MKESKNTCVYRMQCGIRHGNVLWIVCSPGDLERAPLLLPTVSGAAKQTLSHFVL